MEDCGALLSERHSKLEMRTNEAKEPQKNGVLEGGFFIGG